MRICALVAGVCAAVGAPQAMAGPAAGEAPPRYLNTLEFLVEARAAGDSEASAVEAWISPDGGRHWSAVPAETRGKHGLLVRVAEAGEYGLYVVLRNRGGVSAPPPEPGSPPLMTVIVDTLPPLVQLHGPVTAGGDNRLEARCTLLEENLEPDGVRIFVRTDGARWVDAGRATYRDGRLSWRRASDWPTTVDLRAVVTDRAGNRATSDLLAAAIPAQPALPAVPPAHLFGPPAPAAAPLLEPMVKSSEARLAELRLAARRLVADGRYGLAVTRFEEALALAPASPEVIEELGVALHRAGRYEDALARFQAILHDQPTHAGALEGAALAAATLRRYADARRYLLELQKLQPDSASVWLRSGDVEHRLGHGDGALAMWARALRAATSDPDTREQARRRLQYFGRASATPDAGEEAWPPEADRRSPSRSSSSSVTTTTRKPSR